MFIKRTSLTNEIQVVFCNCVMMLCVSMVDNAKKPYQTLRTCENVLELFVHLFKFMQMNLNANRVGVWSQWENPVACRSNIHIHEQLQWMWNDDFFIFHTILRCWPSAYTQMWIMNCWWRWACCKQKKNAQKIE